MSMPSSLRCKHCAQHLEFCDLSSELDQVLSFLAVLSAGSEEGYANFLWDYLGKRLALEHVFFDRCLGLGSWDELKLKAEIWRVQKVLARQKLPLRSERRSNRARSNQRD
jgi:hypothetical protein